MHIQLAIRSAPGIQLLTQARQRQHVAVKRAIEFKSGEPRAEASKRWCAKPGLRQGSVFGRELQRQRRFGRASPIRIHAKLLHAQHAIGGLRHHASQQRIGPARRLAHFKRQQRLEAGRGERDLRGADAQRLLACCFQVQRTGQGKGGGQRQCLSRPAQTLAGGLITWAFNGEPWDGKPRGKGPTAAFWGFVADAPALGAVLDHPIAEAFCQRARAPAPKQALAGHQRGEQDQHAE